MDLRNRGAWGSPFLLPWLLQKDAPKEIRVCAIGSASNPAMVERGINRNPGNRFVVFMLVILIILAVLVFSIHKHGSTQPNSGTPPNQRLHP